MCIRTICILRRYSDQAKSVKLYTTPIYYVNANPHIGHLYSSVIADAIQRWQKVLNKSAKIKFSTGTDEHGSKIQQAAEKNKVSLQDYCDNISIQYKKLANNFSVNYTNFIRTTSPQHKQTVDAFWKTLDKNGHIYSSKYSGWYCVSDETFLTEVQLKETVNAHGEQVIVSAESGHPVEWTEELNYMFRLHSFQEDLKYWLNKDGVVRPKKFQKILLDLICNDQELPDVSISRPSARVHWGVRVPHDETQTVYVWLDALANYLTAAGYPADTLEFRKTWPPDVQVIGKDILKFHGIYWPAFLMAANLEPPGSILCHSHWTVDGEKMSKSKNNVVCPFDRAATYTPDGLRYFLLRGGCRSQRRNDTKVIRILNSELADTLGNLLSRCCGVTVNPNQVFPEIEVAAFEKVSSLDVTKKLIENVTSLPGICRSHYDDMNFYKAIDTIIATLHSANSFFETLKPWEMRKNPDTANELKVVLHLALESLRVSAILLQPIVPNISNIVLDKIGVGKENRYFTDVENFSWVDNEFKERVLAPEKVVLFKRIVTEKDKMSRTNIGKS
ncbi:hypothetical protein NQ317_002846 [Molorchus minor]|uniref:Methionine--tRNA ligase, mitochondrial n=1 Tax=Molorchus minor TaxID=1323400 RepID=A0ABQ9JUW1_9CUCU|nr:hypothetical protein NQ317_002846 [Molorchus minor]